ncbi:hypothetical protein IG631_22273 [Alternaria alternata]|nr:hypothetical protein IG631_22273 [Alternaria alternata]
MHCANAQTWEQKLTFSVHPSSTGVQAREGCVPIVAIHDASGQRRCGRYGMTIRA